MDDLLELAQRVAAQARTGEQVEVFVSRTSGTHVTVYDGEVESLSNDQSEGIGVRVVEGKRQGVASAGVLDDDVVEATLAEARDNARFTSDDEWAGLAEPDGVHPIQLEVWSPDLAATPIATKVALAVELERRVRSLDTRIIGVRHAKYGDTAHEAAVASSTGVAGNSRRSGCQLIAETLASDGHETQTGTGYSVGRAVADLDVEVAAADAVTRAVRLLGATKAPSGRVTAVFDPRITAVLLGVLASAVSGDAVLKGRSIFADRVGETVAAPAVTLVDDPTDARAWLADSIDDEGIACRRNVVISGGVLGGFLYDSYAARRAGTVSTGSATRPGYGALPRPGCRALVLTPGDLGPEEVYDHVGDGFLVQSVSGVHSGVNPVSGDFSVGATGVQIRAGELGAPVREVTIASTLQRMLQRVVAVGADLEWLPSAAAGLTLAIEGISLSGT